MKLYKFGIGNETIVSLPMKMLDGSSKTFRQGFYHITSSKEEADYLSKIRGLMSMEPNQKEIVSYIEKLDEVPTTDRELTIKEALTFIWKDENEDYVAWELEKRGWLSPVVNADPALVKDAKLRVKFNIVTDEELIAEVNRRKLIDKLFQSQLKYSEYDLKPLHFSKVKKISEELGIEWTGNKDEAIKLILKHNNNENI